MNKTCGNKFVNTFYYKWKNDIIVCVKGGFAMSYQALYRKYRPKDLTEVYGQHVVVNILKNAKLTG